MDGLCKGEPNGAAPEWLTVIALPGPQEITQGLPSRLNLQRQTFRPFSEEVFLASPVLF
jgi:hypothetical protein